MKVILEKKQLDDLQLHARLYTTLSSILTKTYFRVGENMLIMSLIGKGMCSTKIDIDCPDSPIYFQCDYVKFSNALSKVGFSSAANLNITKKAMKISFEGNSDAINLSIVPYDNNSSEATLINTYLDEAKEQIVSDGVEINLTEDMKGAIDTALSMFTTVGNNNALALRKDHFLYSDRSIVLKAFFDEPSSVEHALIHKFALNIMLNAGKTNGRTWFNKNFTKMYWEDSFVSLAVALDACEVAVPTEEEYNGIIPSNGYQLTIDQFVLFQGLQFFAGVYEASVWKPITFIINNDGTSYLYYKHPSTEARKDLNVIGSGPGTFIVSSEALTKILSKSIPKAKEAELVTIFYDEESPGVHCFIGGSEDKPRYEVVLGKLID